MDITRTIHDKMVNERLLFVYRGSVTDRNSLPLITLLENEMKDDSFGLIGQKRLFMFALESLQNISKHSDHDKYGDMSLVTYKRTDDGYTITTGNMIASENVADLKKRLEEVNNLDIKDIKDLYRQILSNAEFSKKGGAGLGLIEMAIKTGNRLDYDFVPVNEDFSYFILSKTVDSSGMGIHSENRTREFNSDSVVGLERLMAENKIYLTWSGHITSGIGEEVLSITESKLSEEDVDSAFRRRVFNIMVESLENVSKYNPGRGPEEKFGMPVAIVGLENETFLLTTGNLVKNSGVNDLKKKLDYINSYDKAGLKELFFTSLSGQSIETDSTGNMGLISMARKSGSKLNYQFERVNETYSYFMLTVRVEEHPA
jgi:hypothetical protein